MNAEMTITDLGDELPSTPSLISRRQKQNTKKPHCGLKVKLYSREYY